MDMPQKGGAPSIGRGTATKVEVCRLREGELCRKELQQLLEVEGTRVEKKDQKAEGKGERREKSSKMHNMTSERSMDKDRNGED